ncbi:unnamed protein product [Candidula unifasciata]|uniref:BHLH domain-containing protein n=1 Tax=Candidula unifasciata TaxID=100452 RepID=A0A8S3Z0X4_9EUPU|nr:unnamed protein product [Candidula unifasciata]
MFRPERMADSGIEVDFMSCDYSEIDPAFDQSRFYDVKSKVIVTSPVTDIKVTTPPTRTNLRQQLDKQQLYQQEKREQQFSQSFKVSTHVTGSTGITIPRVVSASQVPPNILQVKTPLQHPTRYHVQESQKRQVEHFLSNGHHGSHIPVHSLPTSSVPVQVPQHNQYHLQAPSSAPQPDLANSFLTDPTDVDFNPSNFDLLRELQSVEPLELESFLDDDDLREIQPTIGESLRDDLSQAGLLQPPFDRLDPDGMISSCPTAAYNQQCSMSPGLSVQDDMWRKERIKKDNHNIIERRRRFNINDRIKELGGLLPRTIDPDLRQNKGTILKASVEYIKSLQDDQRKYRMVLEQKRKADSDLRKVLLKLRQMQFLIKSHGIENPLIGDVDLQGSFNSVMRTEQLVTSQVSSSDSHAMSMNTQSFTSLLAVSLFCSDELMDECSSVCGDPMLLSDPLNPDADDHSLLFDHFQS